MKDNGSIILSRDDVLAAYPKRKVESQKGDYGKAVIFGGSESFLGAPKLALLGEAAMRSGCGYATLAVTKTVASAVAPDVFECTLALQEEQNGSFKFDKARVLAAIDRARVVTVGMGMTKTAEVRKLVEFLFAEYTGKLVLDADGLNSISGDDLKKKRTCELLITPHFMEFSRLTGLTLDEIKKYPKTLAESYASKFSCDVLLKSSRTVTTDGETTFITEGSTAALAKAGSGDLLSGVITGLAANCELLRAAATASQLVAFVATDLAAKYNENVLVARDVAGALKDFFIRSDI